LRYFIDSSEDRSKSLDTRRQPPYQLQVLERPADVYKKYLNPNTNPTTPTPEFWLLLSSLKCWVKENEWKMMKFSFLKLHVKSKKWIESHKKGGTHISRCSINMKKRNRFNKWNIEITSRRNRQSSTSSTFCFFGILGHWSKI
jgi:hypothetical protein